MTTDWEGGERRAIPIHILNHMDSRLGTHEKAVEDKLDKIDKRITELTTSINSWMEKEPGALLDKCERLIDELVPSHPENPDATPAEKRHAHRTAHARWIKKVDEEMRKWSRVREEVVKWAVIGTIGLVATALWHYLLAGPKG